MLIRINPHMTVLFVFTSLILSAAMAFGHEQHAQHGDWFRSQRIPGGTEQGKSCCVDDDGAFARERITDGKIQVQWFDKNTNTTTEYIDVPPETIIEGKRSPTGEPTVWWGYRRDGSGGEQKRFIRCFVPGHRS